MKEEKFVKRLLEGIERGKLNIDRAADVVMGRKIREAEEDLPEIDPDYFVTPEEEDTEFPVEDWKYEVANGDTILGYWDWVDHRRESVESENPDVEPPLAYSSDRPLGEKRGSLREQDVGWIESAQSLADTLDKLREGCVKLMKTLGSLDLDEEAKTIKKVLDHLDEAYYTLEMSGMTTKKAVPEEEPAVQEAPPEEGAESQVPERQV